MTPGVLTVNQATATVSFDASSLSQTYDGSALFATATTMPAGLTLDFAYQQSRTPVVNPTNAGDYDVTATIDDPNHKGTASDVLHITAAKPTVSVTDAGGTYNSDPFPATDASVTGVVTDGLIASFGYTTLSYSTTAERRR